MADVIHKAHGEKNWVFTYQDLVDTTGLSYETVVQHVHRSKFNPEDFRSVLIYMIKHAEPSLRSELLNALMSRDSAEFSTGKLKMAKKPRKRV